MNTNDPLLNYMQKQSDSKPFEYFVDELFEDEKPISIITIF